LQIQTLKVTSVLSDPVILSIAPVPGRVQGCELCSGEPEPIRAAVLVRHARGGAIQFAACERCSSAIRRVIAVAGGASANGPAHIAIDPEVVYAAPTRASPSLDVVGEPVVLHEYADTFQTEDDQPYLVRIYGQGRADGTWIGWLAFVATNGSDSRRTGQETSQSSRHHAAYWAMGLEPSYFAGAFRRST
jgi:hypothetical protein